MTRAHHILGWVYALVCALLVRAALKPGVTVASPTRVVTPVRAVPVSSEVEWFRRVKPYCNAVEIQTLQRQQPGPPETPAGSGYHAACFALAGRIDDARRIVDRLPPKVRPYAANIVFDVGHPVADAGDDRSAGPIMELVIDYWPNHYMALYHAGMAEYMLGQGEQAKKNLTEFLRYYPPKDGWRNSAEAVLSRLAGPETIAADPRRPREP